MLFARIPSKIRRIVKNFLSSGSISTKTILILCKNFLIRGFDAIEKQSIVNLSRYGSKGYTSVVLGNSGITFLGEGDYAVVFWLYTVLQYLAQSAGAVEYTDCFSAEG